MTFQKAFPKRTDKSVYPKWEEITLSDEEEEKVEEEARQHNIELYKECIEDAKQIFRDKDMKGMQRDVLMVANSLFEKRASHHVYWKENKAKEKFDKKFKDVLDK